MSIDIKAPGGLFNGLVEKDISFYISLFVCIVGLPNYTVKKKFVRKSLQIQQFFL